MPDRELIHRFLIWLGDVLEGSIYASSYTPSETTENYKASVRTIDNQYNYWLMGISYYGNKVLDKEMRKGIRLWMKNELVQETGVNLERKFKKTAYFPDVELLLASIWKAESSVAISNIRSMFNTTLALNLLADGASRIGEFL